jgi:hypothetical protein
VKSQYRAVILNKLGWFRACVIPPVDPYCIAARLVNGHHPDTLQRYTFTTLKLQRNLRNSNLYVRY